jgi:predicted deacylase
MHCYFNLVSSHHTITDDEGLEVADVEEARTLARAAVAEMFQDGVAEIAHWRGWQMEARDTSGTILFTVGFDAPLTVDARKAEAQAAAEALPKEDGIYAYNKAA